MRTSTPSEPIIIGTLFAETGVTARIESSLTRAALLAAEQINAGGGLLGREIRIVSPDPQSKPRLYKTHAAEMLASQGIRYIFGCYTSACRKAVLPEVERHGGLLFFPTFYEGFEFSQNCIYSGCAPNQNITLMLQYLLKNHGRRFYLVGSNYVFPYETNRIVRDYVSMNGGEVVEERYVPMDPAPEQIDRILDEIAADPDVLVISTLVGENIVSFYQGYHQRGLDGWRRPIASPVTSEAEIGAIGIAAAAGHISSAPYFQSIPTRENRAFLAAYAARFGTADRVCSTTEAVYLQMHLFAQAVARCRVLDPEAVRNELPNHQFLAPQGPVSIDRATQHTRLWPRIGRIDDAGQFRIVADARGPVAPDPYMIMPEEDIWGQAVHENGAGAQ